MTNSLFQKITYQHTPQLWNKILQIKPLLTDEDIKRYKSEWQKINETSTNDALKEHILTEWLINLFNTLFICHNTILVRGEFKNGFDEPEYFPATVSKPAKIVFAHGFFASALHEISHWCIAGKYRRNLNDFGYWYAPDGRTHSQQQQFEQVEIKPQAIECLLTLACGRNFQISQDNLFADFDTSKSTFEQDVYKQAYTYLSKPDKLPKDAQALLITFVKICLQ